MPWKKAGACPGANLVHYNNNKSILNSIQGGTKKHLTISFQRGLCKLTEGGDKWEHLCRPKDNTEIVKIVQKIKKITKGFLHAERLYKLTLEEALLELTKGLPLHLICVIHYQLWCVKGMSHQLSLTWGSAYCSGAHYPLLTSVNAISSQETSKNFWRDWNKTYYHDCNCYCSKMQPQFFHSI